MSSQKYEKGFIITFSSYYAFNFKLLSGKQTQIFMKVNVVTCIYLVFSIIFLRAFDPPKLMGFFPQKKKKWLLVFT